MKSTIVTFCTLSLMAAACSKLENQLPFQGRSKTNKVTNAADTNVMIGDQDVQFQAISESLLQRDEMLPLSSAKALRLLADVPQTSEVASSIALESEQVNDGEESLLVGFPIGLVGQQNIFGGVITKVTDKTSETLGGLKLTDLSPIHVRSLVSMVDGVAKDLLLVGCMSECDETSEQVPLISIPIKKINADKTLLMLDLSAIGKELDLIAMLDPMGTFTKLKSISSSTTKMEYDLSTLVFDIKTRMIPVTAQPTDASAPVTEFTVRWYLKLNSASNPAFVPRAPVDSVGYFKTTYSKEPKITRFSITQNGSKVKYYIKNVPKQYQAIFAGAFDKWNAELHKIINRDLLAYEFVQSGDPRLDEIVAGDIRTNVVEWDLDNAASYGGLGPSIANQFTGETLSANVLIQGPKIIEMYTAWFKASEKAKTLLSNGLASEAHQVMVEFNKQIVEQDVAAKKTKFRLKLGKSLEMNIRSQTKELEDPITKGTFEVVPDGITFEKYMTGYFSEMLDHELGHNLGLRHNFKGNLGGFEAKTTGSVSRSIMEYLGRGYRYLNAIAAYDRMAISYGYKGVAPTHANWFCTDEDEASDAKSMLEKSPECTKSDATSDPFSFWEGRLARGIDMLLETKTNETPVWKFSEITTEMGDAIKGLSAYGLAAEKTAQSWTNFFGKADRPEDKTQIKSYVLASFKKKLCDPALQDVIKAKSAEGQKIAQDNLTDLKAAVAKGVTDLALFKAEELNCD
jgi:Met-zincin